MFYRNVSDALKIIVNDIDPKINFKSWDSEIHNIGDDEEYPMFILAPMVNVMSTAVDELTDAYSISWLVIESLNEEANQDEVMIELNNMSELSKQIFLIFENTYGYNTKAINGERMDFNVIDPYTAQTVTMEKGDNRTGIAVQFTIQNKDNNELCSALDCAGDGIADCDPVTVVDSDGTTVNIVESGGVFACTVCVDATYENSDQTFTQDIASGATFVAPDVSHIDSDGTPTPTPANSVFTCTPGAVPSGIAYLKAAATGQDVSYALYDDGWQRSNGIYTNTPPTNPIHLAELDDQDVNHFFTLKNNNSFSNLDRFTDSEGGQIYGAGNGSIVDYMVDNHTGYGWAIKDQTSAVWATALTNAFNSTFGGFSDWFMPNENIYDTIRLRDLNTISSGGQQLNYSPINNAAIRLLTSTTATTSTTSAMRTDRDLTSFIAASGSGVYLIYRNHF